MSLESRFRAPDGCPDENVLAGFASGVSGLTDARGLEHHLDGCDECRAVVAAVAHRVGLVNRDFKPTNVPVGADGRPRVTDFGLVRQGVGLDGGELGMEPGDTGETLTWEGATPAYMSPEQLAGREVALSRPPGPRWRAVVTLVAGVGLLLAGTDILVWRTREPPETEASKPEVMPFTLVMGERHEFELPGVVRVAVGSMDVVDVQVVDAKKLRFEPLAPGTTPMRVWMRDGTLRTSTVTVRPR